MRFATSCFNGTLLKKNWQRFWPIWALYALIWLLVMPVNLLLRSADRFGSAAEKLNNLKSFAAQMAYSHNVALWLAVFFGLAAAMAMFSYLYSSRASGGMHSLPIRREGLFLTNYLSGLSFFVVPNVAVFLLTLLAEAALGCVRLDALAGWLLLSCAYCFIFYSLAVFCAMLTGHIVALPVFYAIANVLVLVLINLVELVLAQFVYGFTTLQGLHDVAAWFTPVGQMMAEVSPEVRYTSVGAVEGVVWNGLGTVGVYALAALVLTVCALLLYRRRQMERAGDVVAVGWMRPVFRYGVAACCALAFGVFFFYMFSSVVGGGVWGLLLFMVVCGVIGYFIASMLLAKSFRVFHRWKGCLAFLIVLAVITCALEYDAFGFERRVPEQDDVASVTVGRISTYPYDGSAWSEFEVDDPEAVSLLLAAHRDIVARKDVLESGYVQGQYSTSLRITYHLKNGAEVVRRYDPLPFAESELADESSFAAALEAFINRPDTIAAAYGLNEVAEDDISYLYVDVYTDAAGEAPYANPDGSYTAEETGPAGVEISSPEQMKTVWRAVLQDFADGNLGRRTLLENTGEDEYINGDLQAEFRLHSEEDSSMENSTYYEYRNITLQTTAQHTLQALRDVGVLDESHYLLTMSGKKVF